VVNRTAEAGSGLETSCVSKQPFKEAAGGQAVLRCCSGGARGADFPGWIGRHGG